MGLIIRNGIKYVGDNSVELTQAQYDALSQEEKLNGTTYYITDGENITTASAVTYDNTASGMTGTNVQAAIDEMSEKIEAIGGITEHDSPSVSVSSGTFATLESFSVPKGTYIIITTFNQAGSNQQGFRIGLIDRTETSANTSINSILTTGRATIQKTRVFVIPSTTTIYIRAYQNSGSAINMSSHTEIVRIK